MKIKTYITSDDNLIPRFKESLNRYISKLFLEQQIKDFLTDDIFIQNNPDYYIYYPYLFSNSERISERIDLLAIAGFLYYKSIIILDNQYDQNELNHQMFMMANICQEESVKILTSLFGLSSSFWHNWNQRKVEYTWALKNDKALNEIDSFKLHEKLSDHKSAFGKVAIDALQYLKVVRSNEHKALVTSHSHFYTGFQILDDIDDFKEDLKIGQFNIAIYTLRKDMDKRGLGFENYSASDLNKFLYLYGVADILLDKAIDHLEKSEKTIENFKFHRWRGEVRKLNNTAVLRKLNIHAFVKNIEVSIKLSNDRHPNNKSSISDLIKRGVEFIDKHQTTDGVWNEYYNDAGMSDVWSTAFILSYLCQSKVTPFIDDLDLEKAHLFLNYSQNNLWGYNQSWIPDTDSSTFVLLSAALGGKSIHPEAVNKWLSLQNNQGGFATYENRTNLLSSMNKLNNEEIEGWLNPHICVSATALYYLTYIKNNSSLKSLKKFLWDKQDNNGLWNSYWWTSPIYSSSYIIKAAIQIPNGMKDPIIIRGIKAVINLQNSDGSFGDMFTKASAFYTGLVVDMMCENETLYEEYRLEITNAVDWLSINQLADGSWHGTPALRLPAPHITEPLDVQNWEEDTKGVNIRVTEFNRLFTTSIVVASLAKYCYVSK